VSNPTQFGIEVIGNISDSVLHAQIVCDAGSRCKHPECCFYLPMTSIATGIVLVAGIECCCRPGSAVCFDEMIAGLGDDVGVNHESPV